MSNLDSYKQLAAQQALQYVESGMVLGLGTGSTARFLVETLAERLRDGRLRDIVGVCTSDATAAQAQRLGIPIATLEQRPRLDLAIDGADEIDPMLNLIKGLGGALLREKIVAACSAKMIVIADSSKAVSKLGATQPLPVEVTPFGHETHVEFFRALGSEPTLREDKRKGGVFVTDNGNYIYDLRFAAGIDDPADLENKLTKRPGVIETGLFIGIAKVALIADENRVEERIR